MTKLKIVLALVLVLFFAGYSFRGDIPTWYRGISSEIQRRIADFQKTAVESLTETIETVIEKEILTPPPLRAKVEAPQTVLTRAGTINWTNAEREQNGLVPLKENAKLNAAAEAKMRDMFVKQYFEHVSPSGKGPSDLAEEAGYEFIAIGENLALGNFGDDQKLVEAWMNSPGHRANILNRRYSEIGVAVGRGMFEGRTTWLAVQEFGRPLSDCPEEPAVSLKAEIEESNRLLEEMAAELGEKRAELDAYRPKRGGEYDAKVEEYNALVREYNELVQRTKDAVERFNSQATAFNACIESFR